MVNNQMVMGPQLSAEPKVPFVSGMTVKYMRKFPRTVEEAMQELNERIKQIAEGAKFNPTPTQIDLNVLFREVLEDFEKGMGLDKSPEETPEASIDNIDNL